MTDTHYPQPNQPPVWLTPIAALIAAGIAGAALLWSIVSPRADLDQIRRDFVTKAENVETTKRLDQRLNDIQDRTSKTSDQVQEIWQKYIRDREPASVGQVQHGKDR